MPVATNKKLLKTASVTHQGYVRERNEDAFCVSWDERLFVVADGIGGEAAGDQASRMAAAAVAQFWIDSPPALSDGRDVQMWITEATDAANSDIMRENDRSGLGMGTTLVVAVQANDGFLHFGHVGDSRLYSSLNGCLTVDHAISNGKSLTRALGGFHSNTPDLGMIFGERGSRILLCTDGLNKAVNDNDLMDALIQADDPIDMLERLLDMALDFGGPDNITMVAIEYL